MGAAIALPLILGAGGAGATAAAGGSAALILSAAALGIGAGGQLVGGLTQAQQVEANREIAEYNARLALREAEHETEIAGYEEKRHRERMAKLMSTQEAYYAKSGVTFEGSPLLVMEETAKQAEEDARMIRYGGQVGATRAYAEAALEGYYGRLAKIRAGEYRTVGILGAGTSLLGGGARMIRELQ